ncbi:hypothetical protein C4580_00665 [Candidatus Woesearchaeota archaeon]|nr:MAG: hypothetical protein C4580_00665 [Candidatus Woesearchaeota archaeon]
MLEDRDAKIAVPIRKIYAQHFEVKLNPPQHHPKWRPADLKQILDQALPLQQKHVPLAAHSLKQNRLC